MHGYTSDPPVLLEDFLHISLHYLERVQVPNKNPESVELRNESTPAGSQETFKHQTFVV